MAVAAFLFTGPASAGDKVPVTEWQQSHVATVAPYLMEGRALNVSPGYIWRHLRDDEGRIFVEYRTIGGRSFVSLITDPTIDEDEDEDE
jgi:hypothetical protein